MLIFAHIFAGALLGLGLWHLTNDRRAILVCVVGSILPDLIDKSLALVFPSVVGGGRTVFHSLNIVIIILLVTLIFVRSNFRLVGIGVACAILLHQILDEMWIQPPNWFYPLLGPFQGQMIPDYLGTYFWYEITNPSEWVFMIASVAILAASYKSLTPFSHTSLLNNIKTGAYTLVVTGLLGIGLYLLYAGLTSSTATFITPFYLKVPTVYAGLLALCGAVVMSRETFATPQELA